MKMKFNFKALFFAFLLSISTLQATAAPYSSGGTFNNNGGASGGSPVSLGGGTAAAIGAGGNTFNAVVTAAPFSASGFIAHALTTSTAAIAATTINVDTTAGFYVGQVVYIPLGGTSGTKNFAGNITAVTSTTITIGNVPATLPTGTLWALTSSSGSSGLTTAVASGTPIFTVGMTSTTAPAASGATTIAVSNATTYNVGQGMFIYTGTSSTLGQVVSITGVSGNNITFTPGIINGSGVAANIYVQHDDTAAFQAVANLLTPSQNVHASCPDGVYQINGPEVTNAWSPIIMPSIDYYNPSFSLWKPQATFFIEGNTPAPQEQSYLASQKIPHWSGCILQSNIGDGNNAAGIFGAYNTNSDNQFSNIQFIENNLTVRTYPVPYMAMVTGQHMENVQVYNSDYDTGEEGPCTQPTTSFSNNAAIVFPYGNNGGNNVAYNVQMACSYYGMVGGEHTRFEHVRQDNVFYPLYPVTAFSVYGMTGVDVEWNGCPHGIFVNGAVNSFPIWIDGLNIEHQSSPSWAANVEDFKDGSNKLVGNITLDTQSSQTIGFNGAAFLNVFDPKHLGTLAGTTAGSVNYYQPQINGSSKKFTANFIGYENNSVTAQTITFPKAFTSTPVVSINGTALSNPTVSTTMFTIPAPNSTTLFNGTVEVVGN